MENGNAHGKQLETECLESEAVFSSKIGILPYLRLDTYTYVYNIEGRLQIIV